jgi:hypothetical protein
MDSGILLASVLDETISEKSKAILSYQYLRQNSV